MEFSNKFNINNYCRICGIQQIKLKYLNIYDEYLTHNNVTIADALRDLISEKISQNDGLSVHVCVICKNELSDAYKLKKKFEDTSKKLLLLKSQHQNVYYNVNKNATNNNQEHNESVDIDISEYKKQLRNSQIGITTNNTTTSTNNNNNNNNGKTTMVKINYNINDVRSLNNVKKENNMHVNIDKKLHGNLMESKNQSATNDHNNSHEDILLNSLRDNDQIINKVKKNTSILLNPTIQTTNHTNLNSINMEISSAQNRRNKILLPHLKRKSKSNIKQGKSSVPITTEKWDAEDNVTISKLQSKFQNEKSYTNKTESEIELLLNKVNEVNRNKDNNQQQSNKQSQQHLMYIKDSTGIPKVNETDAVSFVSNEDFLKFIESDESKKLSAYRKRKHPCLVCGKRFAGKSNLVDHLRFHANVRPYKCSYCDKTFIQSASLKSHTRVHTRERPYTCYVCEKSFSQSSALKIHIRTHTNERLFKCTICSKSFISQSDLSKHKRIHDLIKKFQCVVCNRGFAQKCNLQKHQSLMHPKVAIDDYTKVKIKVELN